MSRTYLREVIDVCSSRRQHDDQATETFFGKKVFLEQFIKVEPDWRKKSDKLKGFGY